jgi:hypothetical protein
MKTTIKNKNENQPVHLIVISSILIFFSAICFIFHISPDSIAQSLSEFAEHHYLLTAFISFVLGMYVIKSYYDYSNKSK